MLQTLILVLGWLEIILGLGSETSKLAKPKTSISNKTIKIDFISFSFLFARNISIPSSDKLITNQFTGLKKTIFS